MKNILLLLLIVISFSSLAQNISVPFDKKIFQERKDEFKIAVKALGQGNDLYDIGFQVWSDAIPFYEEANKFNPDNASLNYKLGNCYLVSIYKSKALGFYQRAYKLSPTINKDIHFKMGRSYQLQYKLEKALYEYGLYRKTLNNNTNAADIVKLNHLMSQCETGQKLMSHPERVWIDNLGSLINSKDPEYSPMISADETVLMFTTRSQEAIGAAIDPSDGKYMEDIYISEKDENGNWTKAIGVGENINTKYHDATAGLSSDGLTSYIYYGRYWRKNKK